MPARAGVKHLWAPWRMPYIARADQVRGCLFCRTAGRSDDLSDLVVVRRRQAFLMLNRFPYNPAHVMVAVRRHAARFEQLTGDERADLLDLVALAEQALAAEYRPHGVNYGANVGRVAGAGFPGHLHIHLVPRWNGDTNFMPVLGETKVLPESLARTWSRLRRAVRSLTTGSPGGGARRTPRRSGRGTR
jgi:ATP adenylyltransferase